MKFLYGLFITDWIWIYTEEPSENWYFKIKTEQTFFNVTQGNRLMSFAAHTLAKRFPNLILIYKDQDSLNFEFTKIKYEDDNVASNIIDGTEITQKNKNINWGNLFKKNTTIKNGK